MNIKKDHNDSCATNARSSAGAISRNATAIDVYSAGFNYVDGLNDCSGNYQFFQNLDGIITAHEMHQIERERHHNTIDLPGNGMMPLITSVSTNNGTSAEETPQPLNIISKGRVLIIDAVADRAEACIKLLSEKQLICTLLLIRTTRADLSFPSLGHLSSFEINAVSITGGFGNFSATVTINGDNKSLAKCLGDNAATFDLVLDFQAVTSYAGDCLPIGYYAPGSDPTALHEAMLELPEMRGLFKKPQFVSFNKKRCHHGRSRTHDCCECLDICPYSAIQSIDRTIFITHYLCQGCGACALACRASAINMIEPSQPELLSLINKKLESIPSEQSSSWSMVISDSKPTNVHEPLEQAFCGCGVHFRVEKIAHISLELILAGIAYGARLVLVAINSQNPPKIKKAVQWQVEMARALLRALGLPDDACQFTVIPLEIIESGAIDFRPIMVDKPLNDSFMSLLPLPLEYDKRTLVRLTVQHLYNHSGAQQSDLPMPIGSPFGSVAIDEANCTLCQSCAGICPTGALSASAEIPKLLFQESLCYQCGLCVTVCPESAIRMVPRLLCDPKMVENRVVLHEVQPFRCVKCGVPFASQTMVNRIKQKLAGHWMYANERQLRRLQMCSTCRTLDALTPEEINSWNQK